MECLTCKTHNRPGARFCAACGSPLSTQPNTSTTDQESEDIFPAPAEAPPVPPATEAPAGPSIPPPTESQSDQPADTAPPEAAEQDALSSQTSPPAAAPDSSADQPPPLSAGTLLANRYEIVEMVDHQSDSRLYTARDLARCTLCHFDGNTPGDPFCAHCGAALETPPLCQVREEILRDEQPAVTRFVENGYTYVVLEQESAPDQVPTEAEPVLLRWGAHTDAGLVRSLNEDYVDAHVYTAQDSPTLGLFVVADGVGGQAAGEVASRLAGQVIWQQLRETVWEPAQRGEGLLPETLIVRVQEAIQAANQAVFEQRMAAGNNMGTTLTLALLYDTLAIMANVGDSRTYHWHADQLRQITVDHSLVQSLVQAGKITAQDIYTHPQRHIIYRALGSQPYVESDIFSITLAPGDRLILCSDGLWEMIHDEGIEEILLREPDPQLASRALVDMANLAGGADNISVIVVEV